MKNFVVFANCQSGAVARTLMENEEFSSHYQWSHIPPVQNLKQSHVDEVLDKVREADVLIYQPVAESPRRPQEMTSRHLLGQIKESCQALSFPPIYFDGYFPHLQTLNGIVSVLNLVHDYFIVYACSVGLSEEQCYSLINREDLYSKQLSRQLADKSLHRLRERESNEGIDIPVSDFIAKNYKQQKLFNQFNHPKRELIKYISGNILSKIGIEDRRLDTEGNSHLDMIMTPVYRSTHLNLELAFEEDFESYSGKNNLALKQRVVINRLYECYRSLDLAGLRAHVRKTKPFVAKIVDDLFCLEQ